MPLSWNEIKSRAVTFSKEWQDEVSEDAEAKSFWDDFFHIFDISRRRVATFEQQVRKLDNKAGFIDLLWKGNILIEHKSRGHNLDKAYQQAKDYFPGLKEKELPRYILVSDFARFRLYDLDEGTQQEFKLEDLVQHVNLFGFIAGYQKRTYKEQDPVNIEAAELMGRLHDKLKDIGYEGHHLEIYLVRLLFCLFADDTGIFEKGIMNDYLDQKTSEDGSDLAAHIAQLFEILNTPQEKRLRKLDEALAAFPYVNGRLFEEQLPMASFDSEMRKILMECCLLDWGKISPAIFGSLFQSVMDKKARRNLGAHYTSEKNILKLIKPLFLDDLWDQYEKVKSDKNKLKRLHHTISKLRFLDPACGCGNFLVIAYRELRRLELEISKILLRGQQITSINDYFLVDVDQFYGIEYEEFPSQIAHVAMLLMDHQMNEEASIASGEYIKKIPIKKSSTIVHGNALRIDWQSLIVPYSWERNIPRYHYILGNPPFIGKSLQNVQQKEDMDLVFAGVNGAGVLDYVTAWYIRAAQYMEKANEVEENDLPRTKTAFVSTNSIAQGEQVGVLWSELFNRYHCKIHFAHRTFKWGNEAKGNAAVHVVIIGFSNFDIDKKLIFEYDELNSEPHEMQVKNINPYLVSGKDLIIIKRQRSISNVPQISFGSMPNDDGGLLLTNQEKIELVTSEPKVEKYIKPLISAHEFINGELRWCLWLEKANPKELQELPQVLKRIQHVKEHRSRSIREATNKLSATPTLFGENRQPDGDYVLIPGHSSENRYYIPLGYFGPEYIVNNSCFFIPKTLPYHFGILHSIFHMTWIKYICGRIKSDFRYSNTIVYNNFPWPENPSEKQKEAVEKAAQAVLDARAQFQNPAPGEKVASLADLYDPNTMPPVLVKAHQALDKAVDLCYRPQPFPNETKRIEFLFELYDRYTAGMFAGEKKKGNRKVK
ncbi:MAG: class I SAM-dependent DNA methyltransferase [Saprospiraceae bacterium]|uniref:site-specific DNA-methyltransferase (adenine-specific) n=1 Tax=Candidatus Opimibacter skivensis TaxID=2982028 RepID=A0A9D7STI2_9BACT|nr:class I SAM-dependent DNA methyltransferase [Candidatus Opimibacter skivensis]